MEDSFVEKTNVEFLAFQRLLSRQLDFIAQLLKDGRTDEAMKWIHDLEIDIKAILEA